MEHHGTRSRSPKIFSVAAGALVLAQHDRITGQAIQDPDLQADRKSSRAEGLADLGDRRSSCRVREPEVPTGLTSDSSGLRSCSPQPQSTGKGVAAEDADGAAQASAEQQQSQQQHQQQQQQQPQPNKPPIDDTKGPPTRTDDKTLQTLSPPSEDFWRFAGSSLEQDLVDWLLTVLKDSGKMSWNVLWECIRNQFPNIFSTMDELASWLELDRDEFQVTPVNVMLGVSSPMPKKQQQPTSPASHSDAAASSLKPKKPQQKTSQASHSDAAASSLKPK